jgi:integrase
VKLTTTTIKSLALPPGAKDKTFWDDELGGFGLRLREGGSRTWVVQYDLGGKSRRVTLGPTALLDLGAARAKAKELLAQVRLGGDPVADKHTRRAQAAETFGALLPRYLIANQATWRPQSFKQVERRLQKLARPLHPLPLTSIDRRTISRLIADIAERNGSTAATNAHGTLCGYFSWLMREGLLDQSPMLNTNKPEPRPGRERVPTEDELRAVWAALIDGDDYSDIIKLIILTASRRSEIGGLRWDEIDFEREVIEIPGARMKNNRPHLIPLSEPALAILQRRSRVGDYVFGRGDRIGFQGWSARRRVLDAAIGGSRPDWVLHDFRRLASTVMHDKLRVQPHVVERVLAHVGHQSGVAGTYNKAEYIVEKRRTLERWADYVLALVTGEPATAQVVQLRK